MHPPRLLLLLLLLLIPPLAMAAPAPSPNLYPGKWQWHTHIIYSNTPIAMAPMDKTYTTCVKTSKTIHLLPPTRNMACSKPKMTTSSKGYHVKMSCTAKAGRYSTHVAEDFVIQPGPHGKRTHLQGTVKQTTSGVPGNLGNINFQVTTTGQRIGRCAAPH